MATPTSKAILVTLQCENAGTPATMTASCMGERSIVINMCDLPEMQPAHAIARAMCHRNGWVTDLVYGLLPNGDEVFCFRISGRS